MGDIHHINVDNYVHEFMYLPIHTQFNLYPTGLMVDALSDGKQDFFEMFSACVEVLISHYGCKSGCGVCHYA